MTDRFEQRLSLELRALAEGGVRPIDRRAIAENAIEVGRQRGIAGAIADRLGLGGRAPWAQPSTPLVRVAVVLMLIAALLTSAVAGGWLEKLFPWLQPPFPIVEDLGLQPNNQLSAFGSTVLPDGRILLVGGVDTTIGAITAKSTWLFDPDTKQFTPGALLAEARTDPLVVGMADGRVLVLGGRSEDPVTGEQPTSASAEIYDPGSRTFRMTAAMPRARVHAPFGALNSLPWAWPQATLLRDGRVFVSGGLPSGLANEVESPTAPMADIFDPRAEAWTQLDIGCDAMRGTQTRLADGRVLVLCVARFGAGPDGIVDTRARLFDPTTNTFSEAARPSSPARRALLLRDGRVLYTGFEPYFYDPRTDSIVPVQLGEQPRGQVGVVVDDTRVLFLGLPADQESDFPTYLLDLTTLAIERIERPEFSSADAIVSLPDGRVVTVGYQLQTRLLDPTQLP